MVTPSTTKNGSQSVTARADLPEMPDDARKIKQQIMRAWRAYRGDWTGRMPLKIDAGEPDDNVLTNRCGPIVDKGVSFLFGESPKFEVKQADGVTDAPENVQTALTQALGDADHFMTMLTMLAMNGAVAGQTIAKLLPAVDDKSFPRIVVQDPQNYWIETDPDDVNTAIVYNCEYDVPAPRPGYTMSKRVVTAKNAISQQWTIATYMREQPSIGAAAGIVSSSSNGGGIWVQVGAVEEWPYSWSPIHDCMNLPNPNEYWGIADITPDVIHLNSVLNYVQSNTNKIGRLHAHPWPYALGANSNDITTAPGRVICFPSPDTKFGVVEAHGDIANLMNYADSIRSDMDEYSRVPAVALGRLRDLPKGNLSGVALQLLFQPLIEKTTLKRRLYGALVRGICEHILDLMHFPGYRVHINWPNLLPVDDLAAAQTAQLLQQIGVSADTLMQQLGYDPDAEQQKTAQAAKTQLTLFARGQGMPPVAPSPNAADGGANPDIPPVNHPAAVAQRQAGVEVKS